MNRIDAYNRQQIKSILMATHSPQSGVVASRVNEIVGRLRERGHGLTPQRYAVVRALVGGEHPCAEQLFHRVSDAYPMIVQFFQ